MWIEDVCLRMKKFYFGTTHDVFWRDVPRSDLGPEHVGISTN